jgi:hypothetical protein
MKKDIMTEKAARAFRCYARLGLNNECSALDAMCKIRGICTDSAALDMLAVFDTLRLLEFLDDRISLRAVNDIYFATAKKKCTQTKQLFASVGWLMKCIAMTEVFTAN